MALKAVTLGVTLGSSPEVKHEEGSLGEKLGRASGVSTPRCVFSGRTNTACPWRAQGKAEWVGWGCPQLLGTPCARPAWEQLRPTCLRPPLRAHSTPQRSRRERGARSFY